MNLLVLIDQEGCYGVSCNDSSRERTNKMINELDSFLRSVPKNWSITVVDCHDNGLNVIPLRKKYPDINFIAQLWNFNDKIPFDASILIGFHCGYNEGTRFSHTFRNEIIETSIDKQIVGEVSLIAKWLQSHNIPIMFIHGECKLKKEVTSLNLPFYANTKPIEFLNVAAIHTPYIDNKPVKIKLINDKFLDAFPSSIFKIVNNYVVFHNVSHYFSNLSNISIFLNAARNYFFMYVKNLFNKIKWNYSKDELAALNDAKLDAIFEKTSIISISVEDINYIENTLELKQEMPVYERYDKIV